MTNKKPEGEAFEGRSSEMKKESLWLASEDIMGLGDVKVEIEKVYRFREVEFEQGRKERDVYTIAFKNKQKQMVLNSTNRKTLVGLFGVNVKDWAGKTVHLYVDTNVKMRGKIVSGIRIKP